MKGTECMSEKNASWSWAFHWGTWAWKEKPSCSWVCWGPQEAMCLTWFKQWNPVKACDLHIPELHELRGWVWPYLQALACALGTFLSVVPSFFFSNPENRMMMMMMLVVLVVVVMRTTIPINNNFREVEVKPPTSCVLFFSAILFGGGVQPASQLEA